MCHYVGFWQIRSQNILQITILQGCTNHCMADFILMCFTFYSQIRTLDIRIYIKQGSFQKYGGGKNSTECWMQLCCLNANCLLRPNSEGAKCWFLSVLEKSLVEITTPDFDSQQATVLHTMHILNKVLNISVLSFIIQSSEEETDFDLTVKSSDVSLVGIAFYVNIHEYMSNNAPCYLL